ncbi:probable mediator of RNA polymerase II transcription subunit 26b [Punica granatum]|uniref:TFIIS N-terminal domain-containing protein n=2 Tax=Punica granatum TaxID=22663 RepID=A0A218WJT6_PUNGR|nr:probable mediator of RNA polymerase II transcription subunit 26b [Punica granatum]OWM73094.1 hypothetical protein CDL15_Pgr001208 [Punica granatum]PKI63588.1 hypothetical protein CRG98_016032 [Punica granatum]
MAGKSKPLDHWRSYFRAANCDIFDIIDRAIAVAAADCPQEFRLRRDRIAERLFACRLARCSGCDRVELAIPVGEDEEEEGRDGCGAKPSGSVSAGKSGSKESKVTSSRRDDDREQQGELFVSNFSYGEAEALTDEIEEESKVVEEVLRIKELLVNSQEQSESLLYESLRRLQLMALTVGTLKETGIGKAVNRLRKHGSKDISSLVQTLISGWKAMVDDYYNTAPTVAEPESTPDSVKNPSTIDDDEEEEEEEGLPSPPMDEGAFFATQTGPIELSQFFDGMDDDGNPRTSGEFIKNRENGRRQSMSMEKQKPRQTISPVNKERGPQIKKRENVMMPNRPANDNPRPMRRSEPSPEQKFKKETKPQQKRSDAAVVQKRQLGNPQGEMMPSDEVSKQMKLEATKRRLQESYQQVEKAKKQRTIQVMDLHDLPKQKAAPKNFYPRPGMQNRNWANGRR